MENRWRIGDEPRWNLSQESIREKVWNAMKNKIFLAAFYNGIIIYQYQTVYIHRLEQNI